MQLNGDCLCGGILKKGSGAPFDHSHRNSHLDLALYAWETATGFDGSIDYDTDLFDRPTVERMRDHFLIVLEQMIADPGESIRNISVLTAAERRQLTGDWNVGAKYGLDAESAQALFERQVEARPDTTALKLKWSSYRTRLSAVRGGFAT